MVFIGGKNGVREAGESSPGHVALNHRWKRRLSATAAGKARIQTSGRNVIVFNLGGTKYRLITALHYDRGIACILRFLTHDASFVPHYLAVMRKDAPVEVARLAAQMAREG